MHAKHEMFQFLGKNIQIWPNVWGGYIQIWPNTGGGGGGGFVF